ncbi:hypothetical protein CNR22_12435 [Sphingobacteriaceae bacterium]|nr:hypothetical protein CNR22_12435 [Sphingobacteriaceae bacterium]
MKYYFRIATLLCLSLSACKKDRTCSCSITSTGSTITHSQTAGNVINIPPLPPVVIVAATDTTFTTPFVYYSTTKSNYDKVSKKSMRANCASSSEEDLKDGSTLITPGTSTVTTTRSGKRVYDCSIE